MKSPAGFLPCSPSVEFCLNFFFETQAFFAKAASLWSPLASLHPASPSSECYWSALAPLLTKSTAALILLGSVLLSSLVAWLARWSH